jgi:hypothetical protein
MDVGGILIDKASSTLAGFLSLIMVIPGSLTALAFGIMACIPDGKHFKKRDLDVCIGLIVSTVSIVGPILLAAVVWLVIYILLILFKLLFLSIVYLIEYAYDRYKAYKNHGTIFTGSDGDGV